MILELDCGNTRIKWRVLCLVDSVVLFSGAVTNNHQLIEALLEISGLRLVGCRLSSVRSSVATSELIENISAEFAITCIVASSQASFAGVVNGYYDPGRLGVDRWLAILAGYKIAAGSCLIIDVGTAVTADFVAAGGRHLGGYICPGLRLLSDKLLVHAQGVSDLYVPNKCSQALGPGRGTDEAVARGALLMLRGFIEAQVREAPRLLGNTFTVLLTGGDAELVGALSVEPLIVEDLIFIGLAIACPWA